MKLRLLFIVFLMAFIILPFGLLSCAGSGDDDDAGGSSGDDDDSPPMDDDDDDTSVDDDDDDNDDTAPGESPAAPSDLTATAQGSLEIKLEWADNSSNEVGFAVSKKNVSDGGEWESLSVTGPNAISYTDRTVQCEKEYRYRVTAFNEAGESDPSNEANDTTALCEIDPPSDLVAVAISSTEMSLSWTNNAFNATGFSLERRKLGETNWGEPIADITNIAQTTYTDDPPECETNYQYRVKAYNLNSSSPYSNIATEESGVCDLDAPTNLTATNSLAGQVNLSWSDNTNAETGYLVQRQSTSSRAWQTIADLPMDSTSFMDVTVPCEAGDYQYQVRAYNVEIMSDPTNTATGSAFCPVDAPYGLIAEVTGTDSVALSWLCDAENITGFRIYGGINELVEIGTTDATTLEFSQESLDCQTYYRYQVTSYSDNVESAPSPIAAAQTDWCPISPPMNVTATGTGENQINLTWTDNSDNESGFDIQRQEEGTGEWITITTEPANATSYSDTNAACFKEYLYRIKAYNTHVTSNWAESSSSAIASCVVRPRPVLSSISPLSYVAFSYNYLEDPPDPLYPLTITGTGIASCTKVEVNTFLLDCDTNGEGENCQADAAGQSQNCATSCIVSLPDEIMGNAGTYVVRLQTPDPVFEGLNTSYETNFFNVVAPMPEITKIWPRGVTQFLDENNHPINQKIKVHPTNAYLASCSA